MFKTRVIGVVMMSALFAGCSGTGTKDDTSGAASVEDRGGVSTSGIDAGARFGGVELSLTNPESILSNRVVYFDFDSSKIKAEYQEIIEAHGVYLSTHPDQMVTLEGHADERGSREYNVGLGERRANSVLRLLQAHGASANQVSVISYGEEKPAEFGHTEMAWSKNRRVVFVYAGHE